MARCQASTISGSQCQNPTQEGSDYCWIESHKNPMSGNSFAVGNSGRAKRWESPEELQKDIDAYFEECDTNTRKVFVKSLGEMIDTIDPLPYTIEGLCEALDCDRRTLINYEKQAGYEEFFHTIRQAKNKIQRDKVERGLSGKSNASMSKFDLINNHGYREKVEHEHAGKDGGPIETESNVHFYLPDNGRDSDSE